MSLSTSSFIDEAGFPNIITRLIPVAARVVIFDLRTTVAVPSFWEISYASKVIQNSKIVLVKKAY